MFRVVGKMATAGLAGGGAWMAYSKFMKEPVVLPRMDGKTVLSLLEFERGLLFGEFIGITTVTFYSGKAPVDHLSKRVGEIVAANPWLASYPATINGENAFVYNPDGSSDEPSRLDVGVVEGVDAAVHQGLEYADLLDAVAPLTVKKINASPPTDPLFRVTVVKDPSAPEERFALVMSISHVLVDGHGYYRVLDMLGGKAKVAAMSAVRSNEAAQRSEDLIGGDGMLANMKNPAMMLTLMKELVLKPKLVQAGLVPPVKIELSLFEVNDAEIQAQKGAVNPATDGVPWVSTNDVITSWCCRLNDARASAMAINFRNRVDGCTDTMVGNYENALNLYGPQDYSSPAQIRKGLTQYQCAGEPTSTPPSSLEWLQGSADMLSVTNWATFNKESLHLPGCTQLLHIPTLPDLAAGGVGSFQQLCIIFRPAAGKLGVLVAAGEGSQEKMKSPEFAALVGEPFALGANAKR